MTDLSTREIRIPFRVRIGVTGHRDVPPDESTAAAIRGHLADVHRRFSRPGLTPVRFIVLSSLAEGADRLVAREAVDFLAEAGVELAAVLPLEEPDYRQDFAEATSLNEFDDLLRPPTKKMTMPPARNRTEAYEQAGRYIVDHSDVMIALWDGQPSGGQGGTAEIVEYARRRGVPVLVVPARRASNHDRPVDRPDWVEQPWNELISTSDAYWRTEEFNRGSVREHNFCQLIDREEERLRTAAAGPWIRRQYDLVASWVLPRLVRADLLALRYQRWYYLLGAALYVLAALAVTELAAQSQAGWSDRAALLEAGFMVALLATYAIARRLGVHERWIGYRSLAEAFRSSLFLVLSGLRRAEVEGLAGELCATEEPWFQRAFTEFWSLRPNIQPDESGAEGIRHFLIEGWLKNQICYHRRTVQRFQRGRKWVTRTIFGLFGATLAVALLHSLEVPRGWHWPKLFVFLGITLPAVGAALVGVRDQRQFRIHEDRSRRTADRLERLQHNLEPETTSDSVRNLAAQIQTVVEADKLDWSGVIEFQDLEMVL